jgi:Excinuclease ATPase subunit
MPAQTIKITGARQHNLKNLHVEIPREKLVVITGLSGSGNPRSLSTRFMRKGNAVTSKAFPLMRGSSSIKWKSRMSISLKACRLPSPSNNAAPARTPIDNRNHD